MTTKTIRLNSQSSVRSATPIEKAKSRAVGISALVIVMMLTVAVTFTAIALNSGKDPEGPGDEVSTPIAFMFPIDGTWTLLKECSFDELQFNVTMNRWEAHKAVDIAAEAGSPVLAVYAGTVTSVINNALFGTVVTIEHRDGLKTVYSSLDRNVNVSSGDFVEKGQRIGAVGTTAAVEEKDPPHIHLEVFKNNAKVNPADYLDFSEK